MDLQATIAGMLELLCLLSFPSSSFEPSLVTHVFSHAQYFWVILFLSFFFLRRMQLPVAHAGNEPATLLLLAPCSTHWANQPPLLVDS